MPQYPQFTPHNCSWTAIFEMVKQPCFLWACWHPGNLGEYRSIKQLWATWHEGTIIDSVGQMPPLLLVEQEWGGTRNPSTRKGCRQTWRPHNDTNVRRQWSQFMFFVTQVNSMMGAGNHASEAVRILDEQRGSMTVPQFHSKLQPKKTRMGHTTAEGSLPSNSASPT
ncbi:hypothetical protein F4604DRAFT_1574900 [Suillus subluteus]|nr:hypothetical protein F4604DRAFT_1574900 [Suillus subluteus]